MSEPAHLVPRRRGVRSRGVSQCHAKICHYSQHRVVRPRGTLVRNECTAVSSVSVEPPGLWLHKQCHQHASCAQPQRPLLPEYFTKFAVRTLQSVPVPCGRLAHTPSSIRTVPTLLPSLSMIAGQRRRLTPSAAVCLTSAGKS